MAIPNGYEHLFLKNGKAKKSMCACLTWYPKELARLYGRTIEQCAGLRCPYYSIGCGKKNIKEYEKRAAERKARKAGKE
jgi:hypothetical protein